MDLRGREGGIKIRWYCEEGGEGGRVSIFFLFFILLNRFKYMFMNVYMHACACFVTSVFVYVYMGFITEQYLHNCVYKRTCVGVHILF